MSNETIKIAILAGTSAEDLENLSDKSESEVDTPFGKPSEVLISGKLHDVDCVFLARHGRNHSFNPSNVNYRANLHALKMAGCTHVLATTLCGSLKEDIKPGDFVVLDQFYDKTYRRKSTVFDGDHEEYPGVHHLSITDPFCSKMRELLIEACKKAECKFHETGTTVTIEGPRFSTKAESIAHRKLGFDVVGMTTATECAIANELGLCYAALAIVTDYDSWRDGEADGVSQEVVAKNSRESKPKAKVVLDETVKAIGALGWKGWENIIEEHREVVRRARLN